jgi:diaminopimelate epimerase
MSAVAQTVPIVKMNGTKNDFVLLDERPPRFSRYQGLARRLCDRRGPIGADGLLVVLAAPYDDDVPDVAATMRIFNADGSEAEMCGNGIRCVARYLREHGAAATRFSIETLAGPVGVVVEDAGPEFRVRVDMGVPRILGRLADGAAVDVAGERWRYAEVSIGNPHAVVFVEDVGAVDLVRVGGAIASDARFERGTNVHVAQIVDARTIRARHFERGVGITQACGSGAVAVATAAIDEGRVSSAVTVHVPGGVLVVEWRRNGHAFLTGPAEREFERTLEL